MNGRFVSANDVEREQLDWGELGWISRPSMTNAKDVTVIEVSLKAGHGHDFHKHPNQEEVIYVINGEVEQWLETEKCILRAGDSIFIGVNAVHASFNTGDEIVTLMVVLGPCVGKGGYEVIEMGDQPPWNTLR